MSDFIETHPALAKLAAQRVPESVPVGSHQARFGKREVEDRAERLISFVQKRRSWKPFRLDEFEQFCGSRNRPHILLGLAGEYVDAQLGMVHDATYVRLMSDGRCGITDEFILRCAGYSRDRIEALVREHAA